VQQKDARKNGVSEKRDGRKEGMRRGVQSRETREPREVG
jgi:hypothetical protein